VGMKRLLGLIRDTTGAEGDEGPETQGPSDGEGD